jgi:hypothetical protein
VGKGALRYSIPNHVVQTEPEEAKRGNPENLDRALSTEQSQDNRRVVRSRWNLKTSLITQSS